MVMALPIFMLAACGSDSKGPSGTGGAGAGKGGASGAGGIAGTGGAGLPGGTGGTGVASDAGADLPSGNPGTDASVLDGLVTGDSGPTVIMCPADVATASCTPGIYCTRKTTTGADEGCGCILSGKWLCPGLTLGNDGGIAFPDGGLADAGFPACAAGLMTGTACTPEGAACTGGPGRLGCACTQLAGALRWVCL
jgi:hypothetical protein